MTRGWAWGWAGLILAMAAWLAVEWGQGRLRFETDIMALLPAEEGAAPLRAARDHMARALGGRVVLMVGSVDRAKARAAAASLRTRLVETGLADARSDIPDMDGLKRLGSAYFPHRGALLSAADRQSLEHDRADQVITRALSKIYGFAGLADSGLLARDPFLLFPAVLADLPVPARRLALDDGWPTVVDGGVTWVMLTVQLAGNPYGLDVQQRLDQLLAEAQDPDIRLLRLGAVFFAGEAAARALAESETIGLVSLAGTVLLVLLAFRSGRPLGLTLLALASGLVTALFACFALFGSLHVAAQLFGSSLIGIAVDYALLYFGQLFGPPSGPAARIGRARPGILLGAATTILGYGALGLAPFPGFKQVAVFSAAGLAGSLMAVMVWFPLLDRGRARPLWPWAGRLCRAHGALWRGRRGLILALGLLGLAGLGAVRFQVDDDIRRQQSLSPELMAQQAEIQRLAGLVATGRYVVIEGADEQEVLEREEALMARAQDVTAVAAFVPSAKRQADNARLIQDKLVGPHLDSYRAGLGLPRLDLPGPRPPLTPGTLRDLGLLPVLDRLTVAPTLHVALLGGDIPDLDGLPGLHLVDPARDMGRVLASYRSRAMGLVAVSALLMAPLLVWRYGLRQGMRVLAVPVLAVALAPLLLAALGQGFSFFSAMALVLALSMASDYALFLAEDRDQGAVAWISVMLAAATALLSFGLLGLSGVAGVRAFGCTMLAGVGLAVLLSPIALRRA
jgi:predicted exporter